MREEKRPGEWIPDEAIAALTMERSVHAEESPIELAERILIESAPHAAAAIVHLATNSPIERMRYDAARFVLDAGHAAAEHHPSYRRQQTAGAPWDDLFTAITSELDPPAMRQDQGASLGSEPDGDQPAAAHIPRPAGEQVPVLVEQETAHSPDPPDHPSTDPIQRP